MLRDRFQAQWPLLILLLIYAMIAFGQGLGIELLVALLVYFVASKPFQWQLTKQDKLVLALLLQYPIFHLVKLTLIDPAGTINAGAHSTTVELWLFSLILIPACLFYVTQFERFEEWFKKAAPLVILAALTAQGIEYVATDVCRVKLGAPNVFTTPLLMTFLTFLWIGADSQKSRFLPAILVGACIISAATFAGTRGIFLAQIGAFGLLAIAAALFKNWRYAALIALGAVGGLAVGFAIDNLFDCNFSHRITVVAQTTETIAESYGSANYRLTMWKEALILIQQAPLFGQGISSEIGPAIDGHVHVHNMYLSWLLWGGVVSLLSGLVNMCALVIPAILGGVNLRSISVLIGLPVFLGGAMLFDSFLVWSHLHYAFIIYVMMGYGILRSQH